MASDDLPPAKVDALADGVSLVHEESRPSGRSSRATTSGSTRSISRWPTTATSSRRSSADCPERAQRFLRAFTMT